ncbi:MAG TPA: PDZ domain-containing protein, partial [Xanthomonadales bacterium]|nr:PDZ domain-containing protein [Xanthomonadales bacterium]
VANDRSTRLTDYRGMDMNPAWVGDAIYFASDRTGTLNLYAIAPTGGEARAITQFADFDVLWPSGGPDAVVFEQGGYVWRYDAGAAQAVQVPITVRSDDAQALPRFEKVAGQVESFALSPKGERAVFGARGEVFTVPAKNGEPRNESRTADAREHSVSWSPDGRSFAYLSDATGEYEVWVKAADGRSAARRVTTDGSTWRYPPIWSPDSKKLAFADKLVRLRVVDVATGKVAEVDRSDIEDITDYAWSPDSRWLAYVKTDGTRLPGIWLHSFADGRSTRVSSGLASDTNPVFDPSGRYLYFLSNRDFGGLTFSGYEFNYLYTNPTRIYAATLAKDGPALNRPTIDEVAAGDGPAGDAKEAKPSDAPLRVDVDGFERRVVALDGVPAGSYQALAANASGVFFLAGNAQAGPLALKYYALDGEKAEDVAAGVAGYAVSANGEKLLLRLGNEFAIVDAKPGQDATKSKLAMDKLELRVDPRAEWRQEYVDAWRILRDWFYDEGVHGGIARWNAIRDRYAALVPYVTTRADFDYILHEIAGEANAGHVYVQSPPDESVPRRPAGFLGAELESDPSGYFRIAKIFAGENFDPANRSPLTEPGVSVREGEYLIAVDGVPATSVRNAYALLENKAERVVTLRVNSKPTDAGARDVVVKTIASERSLRYLDWVASRRALVERLGGGRIG